jgi:exodeoxyribonuclease VII large subunit
VEGYITLTELNRLIKQSLQEIFPGQLWLIAEIGELKVNRAGHCYLELVEKDKFTDEITARARGTIWSWQFRFIQPYFESITGNPLSAGIKVLIATTIEFHEVYGLSLNIKDIDPNYTLGDMARKRQEVINRLVDEGIFDMNKELELPDIPSRVAIISSPTAAGYEDFMSQLTKNSQGYRFHTKLFEATMQGNEAPASLMAALDAIYLELLAFDVVVIIRGGGSQMDLACFDQYDLAMNVAQFPIPVLTGIGHEKDESVTDLVAHTRMKTPTAVAEFLIDRFDKVAAKIEEVQNRMIDLSLTFLDENALRLQSALRLFKPLVANRLSKARHEYALLRQNFKPILFGVIDRKKMRIHYLNQRMTLLVPARVHSFFKNLQLYKSRADVGVQVGLEKAKNYRLSQEDKLVVVLKRNFNEQFKKIEWLEKNAMLLDPATILKRGFSITTLQGKPVKNSAELVKGDVIETKLYSGSIHSVVKN